MEFMLNDKVFIKSKGIMGVVVDVDPEDPNQIIVEGDSEDPSESTFGGIWPLYDCTPEDLHFIRHG